MRNSLRKKSGKISFEFAVMVLLIAGSLVAMTVYMKRAHQGRLRQDSDSIGAAYAPGYTTSEKPVTETSVVVDTTDQGVASQTVAQRTVLADGWERIPGYEQEMWWDSIGVAHAEPGPIPYPGPVPGAGVPPGNRGRPYDEGPPSDDGWPPGSGGWGGSGSTGGGGGRSDGSGVLPSQSNQPSGGYSFPRPLPVTGPSLTNVLDILGSSSVGNYFFNLIRQAGISVFYYDFSLIPGMESDVLAFWYNDENAIVVNQEAASFMSEEAIAAVVGHEATHADYDYYPQKWIDDTLARHPELSEDDLNISPEENSIDQEYKSFETAALVWNEVSDGRSDPEMDFVAAAYAQGEEYLKSLIRVSYPGLPEY